MPASAAGGPEGFLILDKPPGLTSHDVVSLTRRAIGSRRVGHGGTLDPGATGVLVVAVGRATRLLRYVSGLDKSYVGEIVLGVTTDTLDDSGAVTGEFDMASVGLAELQAAAVGLTGPIEQVPPMVSAVRVAGRRLYELAREGIEIERAPRHIVVERFEVADHDDPGVFTIAVDCSSGTFVRTLAADLGTRVGGGAHLRHLRRTRVGPFLLGDAVPLEGLTPAQLRPVSGLVSHLDHLQVGEDDVVAVAHGQVMERRRLGASGKGPWALFSGDQMLAVYGPVGEAKMKPDLVYHSGGEAGEPAK